MSIRIGVQKLAHISSVYMVARASPWTLLRELTTLPQTPTQDGPMTALAVYNSRFQHLSPIVVPKLWSPYHTATQC